MKRLFDFVVVGGGLAGLYSAYHLSRRGSVALIAQGAVEDSNSYHAQGGIAAVSAPGDTTDEHYDDTIVAGVYLNDPDAVRVLTEEAPERIREVIGMWTSTRTPMGGPPSGWRGDITTTGSSMREEMTRAIGSQTL